MELHWQSGRRSLVVMVMTNVVTRWLSGASMGKRVTQFGVDGKVVILP